VCPHTRTHACTHAKLVAAQVVSLPNPSKTSLQFDFSAFSGPDAWAALFGMFYLVFLDSTGLSHVVVVALCPDGSQGWCHRGCGSVASRQQLATLEHRLGPLLFHKTIQQHPAIVQSCSCRKSWCALLTAAWRSSHQEHGAAAVHFKSNVLQAIEPASTIAAASSRLCSY
jgi:hypothetical protein